MEKIDGHFGALAAAATGSNTVIDQLAATTTTNYDKLSTSISELRLALTPQHPPILAAHDLPLPSTKAEI